MPLIFALSDFWPLLIQNSYLTNNLVTAYSTFQNDRICKYGQIHLSLFENILILVSKHFESSAEGMDIL